MTDKLNMAVERVWNVSKWILLGDLYRSQGMPNVPVGAENGWIGHGMLHVFPTKDRQVNDYAPNWRYIIREDGKFTYLDEENFPGLLLDHITNNKERARIFLPGRHGYYLGLDTSIRDFTKASINRMEALIGLSLRNQDRPMSRRVMEESPDWQLQEPISMERVYERFSSITKSQTAATRTETAISIAIAEGIPVISARQLVESQGDCYDIVKTQINTKTGEKTMVRYSRIGLGRIIRYGGRGIERDVRLRIREDKREYSVLTLRDEKGRELPVVLEEQEHVFDEEERRVVPKGEPTFTTKEALEDAVRANLSS